MQLHTQHPVVPYQGGDHSPLLTDKLLGQETSTDAQIVAIWDSRTLKHDEFSIFVFGTMPRVKKVCKNKQRTNRHEAYADRSIEKYQKRFLVSFQLNAARLDRRLPFLYLDSKELRKIFR